jgi:hypothetical protein
MGLLFAVGIPRAAQMVWGKSQGAKAAEMEIAQPAKLRIFALFRPAMGHSAALLLVAAILLLSSTLNHAQTSPPVIRRAQAQNQTPAIVANPLLDPAPAVAPPTLENKPPTPPQVTWNGAQLSIKAENSTLADILSVVRARTNVVIEIPPGAGAERVFTDLGPASPREVLTSLLTGSNFDYVIMASPDNKDVLQSVLLTPRGKGESGAGDTVVASSPGARRAPGYTDADREALEAAVQAASTAGTTEPSGSTTASAGTQESASELAQPISASGQQLASLDAPATSADTAVVDPAAGVGQMSILKPGAAVEIPAGATAGASMPQMMQDLQQMYQQRRRIQAQQIQSALPPTN